MGRTDKTHSKGNRRKHEPSRLETVRFVAVSVFSSTQVVVQDTARLVRSIGIKTRERTNSCIARSPQEATGSGGTLGRLATTRNSDGIPMQIV